MKKLFDEKIVVLDGAMGTMLQKSGLKVGEKPEMLNLSNPAVVKGIHKKYLQAGADIIYTNTFGANRIKLKNYPYKEAIQKGIELARQAVKEVGHGLVAFDMGSIGELVEPLGRITFDEVYDVYKEIVCLAKDEVDLFVLETMSDLYEVKAGVLAVKENTDKPLIVTMSFDQTKRTFSGTPIESMIVTLEGLGVDALGVNCSLGPNQLGEIVDTLLDMCKLPIVIKPNAGLPVIVDGETKYDVNAEEFAKVMKTYAERGVAIVGGCCGTTEEYIKLLADNVKDIKPVKRTVKRVVALSSGTGYLPLDTPKIIGERINPTGKKLMKQAILDNDISYFERQAVEQVLAGANILDINMGIPNIDEAKIMQSAVKAVQAVVDCPLQIDSSDAKAVEAGVRYANGRVIINSVNGDDEVMKNIFPIAKKYGAMVLGLTIDKDGVPTSVEKRLQIAEKIITTAKEYGIEEDSLIIDCLTLTVGAEQEQALKTLQAIRAIKQKFAVKTALGVSNISFGLPQRQIINSHFLTMALSYGLDLAIINPNIAEMQQSFKVFNLISGVDKGGTQYLQSFSSTEGNQSVSNTAQDNHKTTTKTLKDCIIQSLKAEANLIVASLLKEKSGLEIIDKEVIPALDFVGEQYEKGVYFLPQLISSAEVATTVCEAIKKSMSTENIAENPIKVVLATVEGDVHDIGKNIVKTVLQNYGYQIIDLGKDVKVEKVVECVKQNKPQVLGLSALMTTTVKNMQRTIEAVRQIDEHILICVGGAVLSESIAKQIGADFYSSDARQFVKLLKEKF